MLSPACDAGQVLTTRLRHIIDAYADGPGVLCELLQNADDAGASEVNFLLDECSYGTGSLLGGRMADWQGPALLCYNDSQFAPADFAAIARIGQDSKVGHWLQNACLALSRAHALDSPSNFCRWADRSPRAVQTSSLQLAKRDLLRG